LEDQTKKISGKKDFVRGRGFVTLQFSNVLVEGYWLMNKIVAPGLSGLYAAQNTLTT
jgi:hypothetical protein